MAILRTLVLLSTLALVAQVCSGVTADGPWWDSYGLDVGMLQATTHNVTGSLIVADSTHFRLVDFTYDGTCTSAKFLVNAMEVTGTTPVSTGTQVPDEEGMMGDLGIYRDADVTLTLPADRTVDDVKWFAVWCDSMSAGHVVFTSPLGTVPAPKVIGEIAAKAHGVSSDVVTVLDAKTIQIMNFKYDGQGPDAFFVVGLGTPANPTAMWKVPDESGSMDKARQYTGETVELTLPKWLTVKDIDWLSMYCIQYSEDFGSIMIPDKANLMVPPSPNPDGTEYYGQMLGRLDNFAHDARGELYIVDARHLRIRHFYYDGLGPDAFFWVGKRGSVTNAMEPDGTGVALRDEKGRNQKLGAYEDADIMLTLNDDLQLGDLVWISVWCKQAVVNFGSFLFPDTLPAIPMAADLGSLSGTGATATSVMVTDSMTIKLMGFTYDGQTADTFFLAGKGPVQGSDATMFHKLADEMGGMGNLRAYDTEDVTLMLPEGVTVWDIDWFSVFSTSTGQSLATLMITDKFSLLVPPYMSAVMVLANCETLHDHLNVAWQIDGQFITIELSGALIQDGYMAFGLSGSSSGLAMIQADHTAAYYDSEQGPMAVDYYNSAYSLCSAGNGVCPDTERGGSENNMVVLGDMRDGITTVRYRRQLQSDDSSDKAYPASGSTQIVWAMGPLNIEGMVAKHQERITVPKTLDFGRPAAYSCTPVMPRQASTVTPWPARMLSGMNTKTFRVNLGPTGGDRGYKGTTGFNSWGIAWYVNGLLIPELTLKRGENYTFVVEGGNDPSNQAQFHPFYITDDAIGGYKDKSAAERDEVMVYAGVDQRGNYTAIGRYCDYIQGANVNPDDYTTFSAYAAQLSLNCPDGDSGSFTWTPDDNTPDLVYYQCYTHNYLGWKIHVVDDDVDDDVDGSVTADGPWWDSYGLDVGMLQATTHNVTGSLIVADSTHFRLVDFTYDGTCTSAKFLVNAMEVTGTTPVSTGTQVPDEEGMMGDLGIYRDADVTLTLPADRTVDDVKWFAVWCDSMSAGHVVFTSPLGTVPAPKVIGEIAAKAHGVSSDVVTVLDAKTIQIMNFKYDGQGPDAFFVVGLGTPANPTAMWKVPDESGSMDKARQYTGETVELTLPKWLTVKDIDWLSMYCIQYSEDFGSIMIPDKANLMVPPSPNPDGTEYYGQMLGRLDNFAHDARGELYIVDARHLRIRHFYYDGLGPDAFFWVGKRGSVTNAMEPDGTGVALRDEKGRNQKLGAYEDADIMLTLNDDLQLGDLVWISVWCKQAVVNFGSFLFPDTLPAIPMAANLGSLSGTGPTATSVMVTDSMTIKLMGFTYDGQTADTFFLAGKGSVQGSDATMFHKLADEMGGMGNLRAYDTEDVTLMLPEGVTVWDIDWFSVFSTSTGQSLATLMITDKFSLLVPPYMSAVMVLANCETLHDHLNVAWQIDGQFITIELSGALIQDGYMAFGLSGSSSGLAMLQADHTAAYYDSKQGPMAVDYYNSAYSLCSAGNGVCPDTERGGTDDSMVVLGDMQDGITTVRYRRPLQSGDSSDKAYPASGSTQIVWAMGPLNIEGMVAKHQERITVPKTLDFGRPAAYSCTPVMPRQASTVTPWPARMLSGMNTKTFRVNLGPTGGDRGYKGTTGFNSWGIAWYVNGLLIPELTLKRGENYTFVVEGGNDPSNQAQFHPFYITDDAIGGYKDKSAAERDEVMVYAGVDQSGNYTAIGRYCDYIQGANVNPDDYTTFSAYAAQLNLNCADGDSGSFTWTPDDNTPDLVYYQCYTHNYLGWKIHVVDDYVGSASDRKPLLPVVLLAAFVAMVTTVVRAVV